MVDSIPIRLSEVEAVNSDFDPFSRSHNLLANDQLRQNASWNSHTVQIRNEGTRIFWFSTNMAEWLLEVQEQELPGMFYDTTFG